MGKGPARVRGFGALGLSASQTLGGALVGGGVHDNVRRLMAQRPTNVGAAISSGDLAGLTQIEGTDTTSPVVPAPVDAATIADGLWIVQGSVQVSYSGGTGNIRARLVTSLGSPISDWYYGPGDDVNSGAIVPAHFAVFGNSDPVEMEFEALPNTGTVSTISGTITGYLVGSLPT